MQRARTMTTVPRATSAWCIALLASTIAGCGYWTGAAQTEGDAAVAVQLQPSSGSPPAGLTCDPQPGASLQRICINMPETIVLSDRGAGPISITWTAPTGAPFDPEKGITIDPANPDVVQRVSGTPEQYVYTFKVRDGKRYKYTIRLKDPSLPAWDPFIAN